ncbi:hypothetical protein SAMN05880593_1153 [Rhizobium sp. RU36D]|nr:hypothetical protein SAMN05880593_1153 [Rhizobium sp. RU36D]
MMQINPRIFLELLAHVLIVLVLMTQLVPGLGLWTKQSQIQIPQIRSDQGFAYVVELPGLVAPFPFVISSDGPGAPADSSLSLYEDGRRLGPAHSSHGQIRQAGLGAYSHWNGGLLFSSSDGSDPRTNGRTYTASAAAAPNPGVVMASFLVAVLLWLFRWRDYLLLIRDNKRAGIIVGSVIFYLVCVLVFLGMGKQDGEAVSLPNIFGASLMVMATVAVSAVFEYFDVFGLRWKVPHILRRLAYLVSGFLAVVAVGFSLGLFPAMNVGAAGFEPMLAVQAKPSGLASAIVLHALGSLFGILLPFLMGCGALGHTKFGRSLSLHGLMLAGYPIGLGLVAAGVVSFLALSYGWVISVAVLVAAALGWRMLSVDRQLLRHYSVLVAALCPFGLLYALWIGLDWHGPFAGAGGLTSGDLSFYSNSIWSLQTYGLPMPNLAVDGEKFAQAGVPNMLIPMVGAIFAKAIPLDPYLFVISFSTMAYVLGIGILLTAFLCEHRHAPIAPAVKVFMVLALIAAGRYPYWIAESPPVAHAIPVAVSIFWYSLRLKGTAKGIAAGILAGVLGSAVSKIVSLSFFVCLSLWPFDGDKQKLHRIPKSVLLVGGIIVGAYVVLMLLVYGQMYLSIGRFGSESYRYYWSIDANILAAWPFIARDCGVLFLLALCVWLLPMPFSVAVAFVTFLAYPYLFQINMALAVLSLALFFVIGPDIFRRAPVPWTTAIVLTVPAMFFTDPSGIMTGPIWFAVVAGIFCCALAFSAFRQQASNYVSTACRISGFALGMIGLLVVAVESKHLSVATHPVAIPFDAMEIWAQVRSKTEPDTLVFTDQTSPDDAGTVTGKNSVVVSGTRQVYVANWVQSSLRTNAEAKSQRYQTNEAVLSGQIRPDAVDMSRPYTSFAAVVKASRVMPAGWSRLGGNAEWALYAWNG